MPKGAFTRKRKIVKKEASAIAEASFIFELFIEVNDLREVGSFQRRAADQAAVDFGHCHKLFAVARVHRATVLNTYLFRALGAERFAQFFTNVADRLVRLFARSCLARADCPNGFVGNYNFGKILNSL